MPRLMIRAAVFAVLLVPTAARAQPPEAGPVASPPPADPAIDLFARKCGSCHTVGKGHRVGPDLKGVLGRRQRAWVERFIATPSAMLDTDPAARQLLTDFAGVRMPDLGLAAADVKALVDLVDRCSAQPCSAALACSRGSFPRRSTRWRHSRIS